MDKEQSAITMSANNSKFNLNAQSFVPSAPLSAPVGTLAVPDIRNNEKRPKQRPQKQGKSREGNKRSSHGGNNNSNNNNNNSNRSNYKDPLGEEFLIGKMKPNSKRGQISINHLLDFSLPDSHSGYNYSDSHRPRRDNRRRKSNNNYGSKVHLTGDRYINVNYKFVVDHRGDYRAQVLDTNLPIQRSNILRVIIPKNDTQCPICLSDNLIAPRMASCGHCFCLTCLLRYLDSEDPIPPKKNEPVKTTPKLKECPLCSKKIKPEEILAVLINPIDERFETPKIGEEAVLQLMYRPYNKILALPYQLKLRDPSLYGGNLPWFTTSDSRKYDVSNVNITGNDLFQYSRLMKADLSFTIDNYLREIREIKEQYLEDKLLYNDDGVYYNKAIDDVESSMMTAEQAFALTGGDNNHIKPLTPVGGEISLDELTQRQLDQSEFDDSNTYFFYQTSFNSKIKFFVSSLDNKILKSLYGTYSNMPLCMKIKVENIAYDFVVNEELTKRFKFLSYLPNGTEVAFLELDWFETSNTSNVKGKRSAHKRTSILPMETYQQFQKELNERSDKIRLKNFREEKSRVRYQNELELKTREFYANENNFTLEDYGYSTYNKFDALTISDDEANLPPLSSAAESTPKVEGEYQTTVWGTKIAKADTGHDDEYEENDDDFFNELLRQSREKEERKKLGKKGRKKLIRLESAP